MAVEVHLGAGERGRQGHAERREELLETGLGDDEGDRMHRDVISSVTFWGVVDSDGWLSDLQPGPQDFPLLFDAQQAPKPAFWALVDFCN